MPPPNDERPLYTQRGTLRIFAKDDATRSAEKRARARDRFEAEMRAAIHETPSLSENPGAGIQGSVGHGKSGGSQGSGQNGCQTNENIYENPSLTGNPENATELKVDDISHGYLGGN